MATKLAVYQSALRLLGSHQLLLITDNLPARLRLDEAWDGVVAYCLKRGMWNFAIKTLELADTLASAPDFGFEYGFNHPADFVRLVAISDEPNFVGQFNSFENENGKFYANVDTLYLRYVSNHVTGFGGDLTKWSQEFADVVAARLAFETALAITSDRGLRQDALAVFEKNLSIAKSLDAVDERVRFRPEGRLVQSRFSTRGRSYLG